MAQGVEEPVTLFIDDRGNDRLGFLIVPDGILIDRVDVASRQNVVELVEKECLVSLVQFFLRVLLA